MIINYLICFGLGMSIGSIPVRFLPYLSERVPDAVAYTGIILMLVGAVIKLHNLHFIPL